MIQLAPIERVLHTLAGSTEVSERTPGTAEEGDG